MSNTVGVLVAAVQQATLTGVVRDSVDLDPIAFAQVSVATVDGEGVVLESGATDRFGAFVVPGIPAAEPVRVEVTALGYAAWIGTYATLPADPLRVLLSPVPTDLDELNVAVDSRWGDPLSLSEDAFVFDSAMVRKMPAILETDVLRAIAISPAASAASDYVSVPFIRGGTSDGTPVLLDGVRLFNAFHLGGFVSAVNAEVVERVTLLPGSSGDGFAVGSLSGAIDIATRDGSRHRRRMAGSIGLASSRLSVEGPAGENVSFFVNGRRTYIDGFTVALEKLRVVKEHVPYFFADLHAKVTADLGENRQLSVSGFINSESVERVDNAEIIRVGMTWGNSAFSVHYRDRLGAEGVIDASLGHSRFTSDMLAIDRVETKSDGDSIVDYITDTLLWGGGTMGETRADVRATWHAGDATVTIGTQATRFAVDQSYDVIAIWRELENLNLRVDLSESQWRLAAFSSVEVPLHVGFSTRAGMRVDRFQGLATTLAPFGEIGYASSWWIARLSASRSHQALASVRNEETLAASFLAYDLLVPVDKAPVPRNTELSIGWQGYRGGLRVRLEAYARWLDGLRLPDPSFEGDSLARRVLFGDPSKWEVSNGTARGIEASWSWMDDERISILGSYRWALVSRTVDSLTYTPRFHRDHEFELVPSYSRGASSWSARVSLRSGQPVTQVLAVVPVTIPWPGPNSDLFLSQYQDAHATFGGGYNSARLPHYARIDVGWRRKSEVSWFGGGSVVLYASVANLFSVPNVVGLRLVHDISGGYFRHGYERVYTRQLPTVPFFGVEFRF